MKAEKDVAPDCVERKHVDAVLATLAPKERALAESFVFAHDRRDYVLAHALLRNVLSTHSARPPDTWRFTADARGKPRLGWYLEALQFSLSHTTGCVTCAVATAGAIGVDVERLVVRHVTIFGHMGYSAQSSTNHSTAHPNV